MMIADNLGEGESLALAVAQMKKDAATRCAVGVVFGLAASADVTPRQVVEMLAACIPTDDEWREGIGAALGEIADMATVEMEEQK